VAEARSDAWPSVGLEEWTRKFLSVYGWSAGPLHDLSDLYQDAFIVWCKCKSRYGRLPRVQLEAIYRRALYNHLVDLGRKRARRAERIISSLGSAECELILARPDLFVRLKETETDYRLSMADWPAWLRRVAELAEGRSARNRWRMLCRLAGVRCSRAELQRALEEVLYP